MRLIDADMLTERITMLNDADLFTIGRVIASIDTQPTAYDIDKVVEKLEELKRYNLSLGDAVCDIQENGVNRHFVCLEDVNEMVKRGSKE